MKKATTFLFSALVFVLASACEDDPRTKYEELTVKVNIHDAKYQIYKCSYEEPVESGSGRDLEDYFLLATPKCYRVRFEPVDGFYTPEIWEGELRYGSPEIAEGMYESMAGMETLMVRSNIAEGWWWVTADPDNETVAFGPQIQGEGDEWNSYQLPAYVSSPSYEYTVHCGDVAGYKPTPIQHKIELIVGTPREVQCMYSETGTDGPG